MESTYFQNPQGNYLDSQVWETQDEDDVAFTFLIFQTFSDNQEGLKAKNGLVILILE